MNWQKNGDIPSFKVLNWPLCRNFSDGRNYKNMCVGMCVSVGMETVFLNFLNLLIMLGWQASKPQSSVCLSLSSPRVSGLYQHSLLFSVEPKLRSSCRTGSTLPTQLFPQSTQNIYELFFLFCV